MAYSKLSKMTNIFWLVPNSKMTGNFLARSKLTKQLLIFFELFKVRKQPAVAKITII